MLRTGMDHAPIIVSALLGPEDFAWLDGLRRAHFPPARNQLDAHLTLFHHLPQSVEVELAGRLTDIARRPAPTASAGGVLNLGRGVAILIVSQDLERIRAELASAFAGSLTPQDAARWRPHVTIQNKVQPTEARSLFDTLAHGFRPRDLRIVGLAAWWYRGGPWELLSAVRFEDCS